MFFRARRTKRTADAVLSRVQPFISNLQRLPGGVPAGLATDKYTLGFFCANIGVETLRAGGRLPTLEQGTILFLVLEQLFGRAAVRREEIAELLNAHPTVNFEFQKGSDAALKIQALTHGKHALHDDPDYIAAREVIRRKGGILAGCAAGPENDIAIAGEMLRALYYQHVMNFVAGGRRASRHDGR